MLKRFLRGILVLLQCFLCNLLYSQICAEDYFNIDYNTPTVQAPSNAVITNQKETLLVGNVKRYHSLLQQGWLTKLSAQGSVLWSRQYSSKKYNWVAFNKVIPTQNDTYLITGNIGDADTSFPITHLSQFGFLMQVDNKGTIIWCKILNVLYALHGLTDITDIQQTNNGDFILALSYSHSKRNNIIMRLSGNGDIIWSKLINTSPSQAADFGDMKLKQLSNGTIVSASYLSVMDDQYSYERRGYYILNVDSKDGALIAEKFFLKKDTLSFSKKAFSDIVGITEMPNHHISFLTSYGDAEEVNSWRKTSEVLNFVLDSVGNFNKVYGYSNSVKSSIFLSDFAAIGNTGERILLMDDANIPYLVQINKDGGINWQRSFPFAGGLVTKTVLASNYGFHFFSFINDGGSKFLKFTKTDLQGKAPCIESSSSFVSTDITQLYFQQVMHCIMEPVAVTSNVFTSPDHQDYFVEETPTCRNTCCKDVVDTAAPISLCNQNFYVLPNRDTVKNNGTYGVVHKTSKGCDSIVYYKINFSFSPDIKLGNDTCFSDGIDSLVLKANPGYEAYTWNGISSNRSFYIARLPGFYRVSVKNSCGTAMDTIQVFEKCDFDIYMPNAFTPNNDGLNDFFKIPEQVMNRLIRFTIYNRWGEVVYTTKNVIEGWNGKYKSYEAPAGVYVYYLEMQSLDGRKRVTKKGQVVLLR